MTIREDELWMLEITKIPKTIEKSKLQKVESREIR